MYKHTSQNVGFKLIKISKIQLSLETLIAKLLPINLEKSSLKCSRAKRNKCQLKLCLEKYRTSYDKTGPYLVLSILTQMTSTLER